MSFVASSPQRCAHSFSSSEGFGNSTARRFSSNVPNSRSRVFRYSIFTQGKVPANMHSVRLEPKNLISVGYADNRPSHQGHQYLHITITGDHIQKNLRPIQKSIYFDSFTINNNIWCYLLWSNNIWCYLLWSPVLLYQVHTHIPP